MSGACPGAIHRHILFLLAFCSQFYFDLVACGEFEGVLFETFHLKLFLIHPLCVPGKGSVIDVPSTFFENVIERRTQVTIAEALVPVMLLLFEKATICHSTMLTFTDNMAVQCSMSLGHCKAPDIDCLCQAVQIQLFKLGIRVWWEYVPTQSNCSDGGSRVGTVCKMAEQLGVKLTARHFPKLPSWRSSPLGEWMNFLQGA